MTIKKQGNYLIINLNTLEKIFSLHGDFKIKESNIKEIKKGRPEWSWREIRIPGTYFPGLIKAGTYYSKRGKEFWYWAKDRKYTHTIELKDMKYKRLVLSSNDIIKGV